MKNKKLPTKCPPHGLCLPATYLSCRDGDTPVFQVTGGIEWAIRLIGINCPELNEPGGQEAKEFSDTILRKSPNLSIHIPVPKDLIHPLKSLSFDRIPGFVWIKPTQSLNKLLVQHKHATLAAGWSLYGR